MRRVVGGVFFAFVGVVVLGSLLGALLPAPVVTLPTSVGSRLVYGDGKLLGCAEVLPVSRQVEGERFSKDGPRPMVFVGADLVFTNKAVAFPVVVWWLYRGVVVWSAHMSPDNRGPFPLARGLVSDSSLELGPEAWPGWDAVSVRYGSTCVG